MKKVVLVFISLWLATSIYGQSSNAWYAEQEVNQNTSSEAGVFYGLKVGESDEYMLTLHSILYEADSEEQDLENGTCEFVMEHFWENHLMTEGIALYHNNTFAVIISAGEVSNNKEANVFLNDIRTKYGHVEGIEDADFAQFLLMLELGTNWSAWSRVGDVGIYACVIDGHKMGIYYHIPTMRELMASSRQ